MGFITGNQWVHVDPAADPDLVPDSKVDNDEPLGATTRVVVAVVGEPIRLRSPRAARAEGGSGAGEPAGGGADARDQDGDGEGYESAEPLLDESRALGRSGGSGGLDPARTDRLQPVVLDQTDRLQAAAFEQTDRFQVATLEQIDRVEASALADTGRALAPPLRPAADRSGELRPKPPSGGLDASSASAQLLERVRRAQALEAAAVEARRRSTPAPTAPLSAPAPASDGAETIAAAALPIATQRAVARREALAVSQTDPFARTPRGSERPGAGAIDERRRPTAKAGTSPSPAAMRARSTPKPAAKPAPKGPPKVLPGAGAIAESKAARWLARKARAVAGSATGKPGARPGVRGKAPTADGSSAAAVSKGNAKASAPAADSYAAKLTARIAAAPPPGMATRGARTPREVREELWRPTPPPRARPFFLGLLVLAGAIFLLERGGAIGLRSGTAGAERAAVAAPVPPQRTPFVADARPGASAWPSLVPLGPPTVEALTSPRPEVRREAVARLGSSGGADGVTALVDALVDSDPGVREHARLSLSRLRLRRGVSALSELRARIEGARGQTLELYVEGLGAAGPEAAPLLLWILEHSESDKLRLRALGAIGQTRCVADRQVIDAVLALCFDESEVYRAQSAATLGRIGWFGAVPALTKLLEDPSSNVRQNAHWALRTITRQGHAPTYPIWGTWWNSGASELWSALVATIQGFPALEPAERRRALAQLDVVKDPRVSELAAVCLWQPDPELRRIAARVLGGQGQHAESSVPYLIQALPDKDRELARLAHQALTSITGQRLLLDQADWIRWWQQDGR